MRGTPSNLFDDPGSYLQRRYHYDKAGELASSDRQRGASVYRYLKTGDLLSRSTREHLNNEHFETDPDGSTWRVTYDSQGNLLTETDALGHTTQYLNSNDGLPHTIVDATGKSKYLWWNALAQVERFQNCSGKSTSYRYDDRYHLVAITNALNQTTALTRKPNGEVLHIEHPDGSTERFTYNAFGHPQFYHCDD